MPLSEKWPDGLRTLHGLQTNGFPNCFFLGFTQTAVTVSVPHALNEQAKHITYILDQARQRERHDGRVDRRGRGVRGWTRSARRPASASASTPSARPATTTTRASSGNPNGFFSGNYGAGPIPFFKLLDAWRAEGTMPGELLDGAPVG